MGNKTLTSAIFLVKSMEADLVSERWYRLFLHLFSFLSFWKISLKFSSPYLCHVLVDNWIFALKKFVLLVLVVSRVVNLTRSPGDLIFACLPQPEPAVQFWIEVWTWTFELQVPINVPWKVGRSGSIRSSTKSMAIVTASWWCKLQQGC